MFSYTIVYVIIYYLLFVIVVYESVSYVFLSYPLFLEIHSYKLCFMKDLVPNWTEIWFYLVLLFQLYSLIKSPFLSVDALCHLKARFLMKQLYF